MYRTKFAFLYVVLGLVAAVAVVATIALVQAPPSAHRTHSTQAQVIPSADWGHVKAYDNLLVFTLGPVTDQRRRYELALGRVAFTRVGLATATDDHGSNLKPMRQIPPTTKQSCIGHWRAKQLDVIVAVASCVPPFVMTDTGQRAHEWVRIDSRRAEPVAVLLKYG